MKDAFLRALKWLIEALQGAPAAALPAPAPAAQQSPLASEPGMKKVCAFGSVVRGIDVSHWQPNVDWPLVKREGFQFAFIKASEGVTYVDRSFDGHWAEAKAAGVIRGAYHFFHPGIDPVAQAQLFGRMLHTLEPSDLPPVIDWETTDGVPAAKDLASGLAFLRELEKVTGRRPIIYTGPYFFQALKASAQFAEYPLWIAHYGAKCPLVPFPWRTWSFWQTSGSGKIAAIPGLVDMNYFNGTLEELKSLIAASAARA